MHSVSSRRPSPYAPIDRIAVFYPRKAERPSGALPTQCGNGDAVSFECEHAWLTEVSQALPSQFASSRHQHWEIQRPTDGKVLKKLITGLVVLFVSATVGAFPQNREKTWLGGDWLKGSVKKIKVEDASYRKIRGQWAEGERRIRTVGKYGDKGGLELSDYDADGTFLRKTIWLVDTDGKSTGNETFNGNGFLVYRSVPTTRIGDEVAEEAEYDGVGNLLRVEKYTYDDKGKTIQIAFFRTDGSPSGRFVTTYNDDERETSETNYSADGKITTRLSQVYDDKGRLVEKDFDEGYRGLIGGPSRQVFMYDENGMLAKMTNFDEKGTVMGWETHSFDSNGNQVEVISFNTDGSLSEKEIYLNDSVGNWVKKVRWKQVARNGETSLVPIEASYRTIEYFDWTQRP